MYELPERSLVRITAYNILGEVIKILDNGEQPEGTYKITFDADALPSGVYIITMEAGNYRHSIKYLLLSPL